MSETGNTLFGVAFVVSILITLLSAIEFILALVLPGSSLSVKFCYAIAPSLAIPLLLMTTIIGVFVSMIGLSGLVVRSRQVTAIYFYASFLVIALNLVLFIFLIMSQYGSIVISSRNINSNELETEGQVVNVNTFADETQQRIVQFAVDNPEDFEELQNRDRCCGLNIQAIFGFGIEGFDVNSFHSGQQCSAAANNQVNEFETLLEQTNNNFSQEALILVNDLPGLSGVSFFCEGDFASLTRELAQDFAIVYGLQSFFQVGLTFIIGLLLYVYEEHEGGFKPDEGGITARPKVENTVLVKAGYSKDAEQGKSSSPFSALIARSKKKKKGNSRQGTGNQHVRFA